MHFRLMKPLIAALSLATASQACIWDADTLAAERARFPEIAELITGMFPRHSKEFHAWRLLVCQDRIAKGQKDPFLYDDLAVSQHKLGDHEAAIQTMLDKEKVYPGQYETYSNLGTFSIYTGQLKEADRYISRALEINADAHIGREKYQLWLIRWLQGEKTPVPDRDERHMMASVCPAALLRMSQKSPIHQKTRMAFRPCRSRHKRRPCAGCSV